MAPSPQSSRPPLRRAAASAAISKTALKSKKAVKKSPKSSKSPKKVAKSSPKSPGKKVVVNSPGKKSASPKRRVPAKKATVRAPIKSSKSEKEEEIADSISIESDEVPAGVTTRKGLKVKPSIGKKRVSARTEKAETEESKATETESETAELVLSPSNLSKNPKKRSKAEKKAKKAKTPKSPVKKSPGRPIRVVHPFNGGQRLAQLARNIFTDPHVPADSRPQAIVVEKAIFDASKARRVRSPWTEQEIKDLNKGVQVHGEGAWAAILNDRNLCFIRGQRSQVDLKDKWRNMKAYVPYKGHPIRRFILVDSAHQPLYTAANNLHIFNNRWPRDAAMKVATRDSTYPLNADGTPQESVIIHLKEEMDDQGKSERPQIVHVYRATRVLQRPRNIKKFEGYAAVWTGKVEKVAEEILIKSNQVVQDQ